MDITKLFGLPAHPLLVHIPIVLVPMVAAGGIALVAVPSWRARFGTLLVVLAGVALVGVQLALSSGEGLEPHVERSSILHRHTEMADSMRPLALGLFLVTLAFVVLDARRRNADASSGASALRLPMAVAGGLVVLLGVVSSVRLAQVGHNGARASWHDVDLTSQHRGEGGGD
ncbi:MAG: hypothetical protein QOD30_1529 [Actinomycetota bacterium]|jgi:uncharacterized membrane protein|nr:hypothetical protein [Actinomycetota bacterium]